ncbi:YcjF family protein [Larsenimonas salina]|uniref:YcjF family protein n=1 Tax=Larsenimonas salina TaxID=1295565 RepID=UPI002074371C|nr:TIGR01620 family protein [Larsenimonas salina]MCM5703326.1 YcjF family protein [Larsenimonas salina]
MTDPKPPRRFEVPTESVKTAPQPIPSLATAQHFPLESVGARVEETPESDTRAERAVDDALSPPRKRRWGLLTLLSASLVIGGVQCGVQVYEAVIQNDPFSGLWAALGVFGAGLLARSGGKELLRLKRLRRHAKVRKRLENTPLDQPLLTDTARHMRVSKDDPHWRSYQNAVNAHHDGDDIRTLFSHHLLGPRDRAASQLITRMSSETAAMVAISPITLLDMGLVAWRNMRMIDRLADIYGLELGYASRLRLYRHVLANLAFAGASEIAVDMGSELLGMNLAEKLSSRAAQGLGSGLMTARLGLRAQRLLRPLPFTRQEQPTLGHVRKALWQQLKRTDERR